MKDKEHYILERKKSVIKSAINEYYGSSKAFSTRSRKRELVFTRQLYMYFMKKHTNLNLINIGASFELLNYDHATVIHGIKTVKNIIDTSKNEAYKINKIAGNVFMGLKTILDDIEKDKYFIDLMNCYSLMLGNGKTIILSGYSREEVESTSKSLYGGICKIVEHNNTNMYLIENKNEEF